MKYTIKEIADLALHVRSLAVDPSNGKRELYDAITPIELLKLDTILQDYEKLLKEKIK